MGNIGKNLILFSMPLIMAALFVSVAIILLQSGSGAEHGGVVVVGPVPLAFGSSATMAVAAMLFGLALMVVFSLVSYRMLKCESIEDSDAEQAGGTKIKGGGVIVIGPVPVVFGTDTKYAVYMMILATVLMVLGLITLLLKAVK